MAPDIKGGDIVLYKKINNIEFGIIWGETYLVAFHIDDKDYFLVRYIRKGNNPDTVLLVSQNPDYAPKEIPLYSIHALAMVKALIRCNTFI